MYSLIVFWLVSLCTAWLSFDWSVCLSVYSLIVFWLVSVSVFVQPDCLLTGQCVCVQPDCFLSSQSVYSLIVFWLVSLSVCVQPDCFLTSQSVCVQPATGIVWSQYTVCCTQSLGLLENPWVFKAPSQGLEKSAELCTVLERPWKLGQLCSNILTIYVPLSQFSVSDTKSLTQNQNKVTFSLSTQTCSLSTQTCSLSTHAVLVCPISHFNPLWKTGLSCILHYSSWKTSLSCILYKLFMEDRSVLYPTLTPHGRPVCPISTLTLHGRPVTVCP